MTSGNKNKTKARLIDEIAELKHRLGAAEKSLASLRDSERRYRKVLGEDARRLAAMVEQSADAIIQTDTEFKITYINQAAEQMYGWSLAEVLGMTPGIFNAEPASAEMQQSIYDTVSSGRTYWSEALNVRKDGATFHCQMQIGPLHDSEGGIVAYMSSLRDISSLKLAQQYLRESEEKLRRQTDLLRTLIDGIPDVVALLKPDYTIMFCNSAGYEFFRRSPGEVDGARCYRLLGRGRPCRECAAGKVLTGGRIETTERYLPDSDTWLEDRAIPVLDDAGEVSMLVEVLRDITAQKKMEEERLKTSKLESVGILAGGIAHDFNNILTGILGNLSLAEMEAKNGKDVTESIRHAEKAAHKATELTKQLLTFAKGGLPVKIAVSLQEIVEESAGFVLRGSNVRYELAVKGDCPVIEVDVGQISQVINNLAINADQAMPEGGLINITVEPVEVEDNDTLSLPPGKYLRMTVKDRGHGIAEENLLKIFDPYFTTKKHGSGLGLATSYSIVAKHGGTISVESEEGRGTSFHVYLPVTEPALEIEADPDVDLPGRGGRILIMDDDETVRAVANKMVARLGYETDTARDGAECVDKYREALEAGNPFAAVIVDLTVPGGMGGKEAVKKLQKIDPRVKAIVASGYSNDPVMAGPEDYGFKGVLAKPFKLDELGQVLARTIENKGPT